MSMATTPKKRAVVSYENMSKELAEAFAEKYPKGFSDYLPDLLRYDKPDGTIGIGITPLITGKGQTYLFKWFQDHKENVISYLNYQKQLRRKPTHKPYT